jgi:hypothetical protein
VAGLFDVVVSEGEIVDRLTHVGLMCLHQQVQVVDAGGADRRNGAGFDRGVGVAADGVADGPAHRPALVLDLDDGQVERGEQQIHDAADQGGVDLIAVAVQRHRGGGGDPALLAPQERAPQQPGIRPRRRGPAVSLIALHRGGPGLRMHAAVILIYTAPNVEAAELALAEFDQKFGEQYPGAVDVWRHAWNEFVPFLDYPVELRKIVYTTNQIESINFQLRKITKTAVTFRTRTRR